MLSQKVLTETLGGSIPISQVWKLIVEEGVITSSKLLSLQMAETKFKLSLVLTQDYAIYLWL